MTRFVLGQTDGRNGRQCKGHGWRTSVVRLRRVPVQEILRDDLAFETRDGRQWQPRRLGGIAGGVDGRVRDALQILVHQDPAFSSFDVRRWEVEVIDLTHPASSMNDEVRDKGVRPSVGRRFDNKAFLDLPDPSHPRL